jgi:hypothetical protein
LADNSTTTFPSGPVTIIDHRGDGLYAEIEINQPGDGLFDDEIGEMLEFLEDAEGENRGRVEKVLRGARRIVSVRVLS